MPAGQLYIKNTSGSYVDAYTTWGISLTDSSLAALMTPPPIKELIESTYRKKAGRIVIMKDAVYADRDVSLQMHLTAASKSEFLSRYQSFYNVLAKGKVELQTTLMPGVYFRFIYVSCVQFSEFMGRMAKFSLKLNEPDPTNRAATDKNTSFVD